MISMMMVIIMPMMKIMMPFVKMRIMMMKIIMIVPHATLMTMLASSFPSVLVAEQDTSFPVSLLVSSSRTRLLPTSPGITKPSRYHANICGGGYASTWQTRFISPPSTTARSSSTVSETLGLYLSLSLATACIGLWLTWLATRQKTDMSRSSKLGLSRILDTVLQDLSASLWVLVSVSVSTCSPSSSLHVISPADMLSLF